MQYTGMMLLEEMASIFLTPYLLLFVVPKRVNDILQFISDFTVDVEGVGDVCSLSTFDFESHGNCNYGSPYNAPRDRRSSQGKMEKSFLSFQSIHPKWEPDAQGKHFLSTLHNFREMQMQHHEAQQVYSPSQTWQFTPGGQVDVHNFVSRDVLRNRGGILRTGYQFSSLWSINEEQKSPPYLLDWYYTSHPSRVGDNSEGIRTLPSEVAHEPHGDYRMPHSGAHIAPIYEDDWDFQIEKRMQSHLEASTSNPFFRDSLLKDHKSGHLGDATESHWWARTGPKTSGLQTSFLEPPTFGNHNLNQPYDSISDRSLEQEGGIDCRNRGMFSSMMFADECEKDATGFNLPFNDIYDRPVKNLNIKADQVDENP